LSHLAHCPTSITCPDKCEAEVCRVKLDGGRNVVDHVTHANRGHGLALRVSYIVQILHVFEWDDASAHFHKLWPSLGLSHNCDISSNTFQSDRRNSISAFFSSSKFATLSLVGARSISTFLIVPVNRNGALYRPLTGEPVSSPVSNVSSAENLPRIV